MLDAKKLKEIVEKNRKHFDIPNRVAFESMIWMVMELLDANGDVKEAHAVYRLYCQIEDMDTDEIVKERIWC